VARTQQPDRLLGAETLRDVVPVLSRLSSLRRDHDDAVGRPRAIDGGRRGRLQHLDVLDVVRVQVGKTIDGLVLRRRRRAAGARDRRQTAVDRVVGIDHAVDDEQRITGGIDRRRATNLDLEAAAGHARAGGNGVALIFIPEEKYWVVQTGIPLSQRQSILEFVAKEVIDDKAPDCVYRISDDCIEILYN